MQCKEYGKHNSDVIILLHGGGLSWWNYREEAELLENRFRVILPILDGHAGSDRDFSTIESNAADIISFIDEQFGGKVLLIGGLSLGGQILLEILSQRADICQYAMVESALVIPSKLTHSMIKPAFGSCYGLIRHRWFSRLQFKSLAFFQLRVIPATNHPNGMNGFPLTMHRPMESIYTWDDVVSFTVMG